MRKYVLPSILLFAVVVCFTSTGLGMNSGAHIYVTEEVFSSDDTDLLYGSIAPDLSLYVPNPVKWETGFEDTHYNFIVLWPQGWTTTWKRFSLGWMVHNEAWGADWYSHIEYEYPEGETGNGYVVDKASVLAPYIPAPPNLQMLIAHNAVEFAIDIRIQEDLDPDLGIKLYEVAMNRSDDDVRRLFNILVAKGKVTDRDTLYQSEMIFRDLILSYSSALASSNLEDLMPLAELGSNLAWMLYGVQIDPEDVEILLQYAVILCSDFKPFLDATIEGIKAELEMD